MSEFMPQGGIPADPNREGPAHETGEASVNGILWFAAILVVVALAIHVALIAWMGSFYNQERETIAERPELLDDVVGLYPGPELPDSPNRDKPELVRAQYRMADSYGWIEPGKLARIPTSRAIDLLAQKGLNAYEKAGPRGESPPPSAAEATVTPAEPTTGTETPKANAPEAAKPDEPESPKADTPDTKPETSP